MHSMLASSPFQVKVGHTRVHLIIPLGMCNTLNDITAHHIELHCIADCAKTARFGERHSKAQMSRASSLRCRFDAIRLADSSHDDEWLGPNYPRSVSALSWSMMALDDWAGRIPRSKYTARCGESARQDRVLRAIIELHNRSSASGIRATTAQILTTKSNESEEWESRLKIVADKTNWI